MDGQKQFKKITFDVLMERKLQSDHERYKTFEIEVPELEGILTFEKKGVRTLLRWIEEATELKDDAKSVAAGFEFMRRIIYESCPLLKSEKIQAAFQCAEPYDIVDEVFCDNLGLIINVGTKILEQYGLDMKDITDKIKN